jgi:predicted homoserine dehydrogenase-like protein
MILIDRALQKRQAENRPIRVAMVGAGFMARGIALQFVQSVKGMRLVAIASRRIAEADRAYREAGVDSAVERVDTVTDLDAAVARDRYVVTDNALLLCQSSSIDAIIEVTGAVEFASRVVLEAIAHRKHVVLMNAELDSTVGPILQTYAQKAGVILTNADGDQPGVIMNLYRFVTGLGVRPVLCGNIKGLQDPYRNPTTQAGFAQRWGQSPTMVTSFADGTKISFEQAIVANATGMRVGKRGMFGPTVAAGTSIADAANWFPHDVMREGPGIVDYVVGAAPNPGVFVLGVHEHPRQQHYLNLYKLGEGPFYCFYTPYHLCHFEVPNTVARAVEFGDAAIAPLAGPVVDVVATAKVDLREGQVIDGIGGYSTYGQCENADIVHEQNLLPMGLAEGCRLKRDIARDQVLTYTDVETPPDRICDRLRDEQRVRFMPLEAQDRVALTGR